MANDLIVQTGVAVRVGNDAAGAAPKSSASDVVPVAEHSATSSPVPNPTLRLNAQLGLVVIEFRNDAGGNVHCVIGKASFTDHDLSANAHALINTLKKMKPATAKGSYIKKVTIHGAMSPGIQIDTTHLDVVEEEA